MAQPPRDSFRVLPQYQPLMRMLGIERVEPREPIGRRKLQRAVQQRAKDLPTRFGEIGCGRHGFRILVSAKRDHFFFVFHSRYVRFLVPNVVFPDEVPYSIAAPWGNSHHRCQCY